jgi:predicted esterase
MRKPPNLEQRHEVPIRLPVDLHEIRPPKPTELIVLLHGFDESGDRILGKVSPVLPPTAWVLAPNGPFPMPHRTPEGYRMGFAWYFYNAAKTEYYIDMEVALSTVEGLVRELGAQDLPKRVIGFSQGGYVAPFLALRLGNVRQVVGMACEFLHEELAPFAPLAFPVDGLCGQADEITPPDQARSGFESLLPLCRVAGRFEMIAGSTHRIDDSFRQALAMRIQARPIS